MMLCDAKFNATTCVILHRGFITRVFRTLYVTRVKEGWHRSSNPHRCERHSSRVGCVVTPYCDIRVKDPSDWQNSRTSNNMVNVEEKKILGIGHVLNDETRPLKERFRALFTLKSIGGDTAIQQISNCFNDSSALLKHELAYCLGQMQDMRALPILEKVLRDTKQEPMVRHEAGEALGAIGDPTVIPVLEEYCDDPVVEVAETCQLALDRLKWISNSKNTSEGLSKNPYASVDPAPPAAIQDVAELKKILLDERASLFERYRAMFSLRNMRTKESVIAISEALRHGSALFKHEIAFVLGQLQEEVSIPYLQAALEDPNENEMVRHECAEALGAIATPDCYMALNKYLGDSKRVVHESCVIALDMCEYENSPEFQYADTLSKIDS